MARNTVRIDVPVQQVYDELLRPENFGTWVVGAKEIRGTEGDWPSEGAKFHHTVGVGPLRIHDTTQIEAMDPPDRVVLKARAWPMGEARVELSLVAAGRDGTEVVMVENAIGGPAKLIPEPINQRLIHFRNRRSLRRLERLVRDHRR